MRHMCSVSELGANLSESVVLQIQATAFDYDVSATFQCMRGTEISTSVNSSFTLHNNIVTGIVDSNPQAG